MNGKELFRGLSYISRRYIDEAEFGVLSPAKESAPAARARLRRPLLIAALIALFLLLVGCGAAYIITRNLNWSKELEKDLRFYNEDTSVGAVPKGWVLDEAMFTLSAAPPENGNVTITCGEWSLDATDTLDIGTEYWIEKWNGTTAEAAAVLRAIDLDSPSQFSYAQDLEQIKSGGLVQKTGGFKNTTARTSMTIDSASRLAAAEIPVDKTNIQSVFYDPEAKIWKVEFCRSQHDEIYYAVYLDDTGITQLVVSK